MCYARRQRSSWARIKLSDLLYIICFSRTNIVSELFSSFFYFFEFQSILTRFFVLTLSIIFWIFKLFNFQGPFRAASSTALHEYSTHFPLCQCFFWIFFKFFSLCWFLAISYSKQALSYVQFYHGFPRFRTKTREERRKTKKNFCKFQKEFCKSFLIFILIFYLTNAKMHSYRVHFS